MLTRMRKKIRWIAVTLWGEFESRAEVQKFAFMALIFGLIIGVYWTMRIIKDGAFDSIVGGVHIPKAKILSLFVLSPLVMVYGKLIDRYPHHRIFYALTGVYAVLTLLFSWLLAHPTIGLLNEQASMSRVLGWAFFVFVESFGTLVAALFWAFAADTTKPDSARRGFPVIAICAQIGNAAGPFFLTAQKWGFSTSAPIITICSGLIAVVGILFYCFMRITPQEQLIGYRGREEQKSKEESGFMDGLRLLFSKGYLAGIFALISLYEFVFLVIENHFKQNVFVSFQGSAVARDAYLANYGTWIGIVAFLCVLFGVNNIQRRLGMRVSLVALPFLLGFAVVLVYINPSALNIGFWIMVSAKAINYALNQPTLKQLYIPTSSDAKYKAQAWIEMFGFRGSKASASLYNELRNIMDIGLFMSMTMVLTGGLVIAWLFVAMYVARLYTRAIEQDAVVC